MFKNIPIPLPWRGFLVVAALTVAVVAFIGKYLIIMIGLAVIVAAAEELFRKPICRWFD